MGAQTRMIIDSFATMLRSVGSDLDHVVHVNVFLADMADFDAMNDAYAEKMGDHRPARTVIGVRELPKAGVPPDHEPDGGERRLGTRPAESRP